MPGDIPTHLKTFSRLESFKGEYDRFFDSFENRVNVLGLELPVAIRKRNNLRARLVKILLLYKFFRFRY
jgi:hypothetical protein